MGCYGCIVDMTISFRGRCFLQMFMLKKPPSYVIRGHVLVDARKSYPYNAYIYSDNGSGDNGQNNNEKMWNINPGCFETCGPYCQN